LVQTAGWHVAILYDSDLRTWLSTRLGGAGLLINTIYGSDLGITHGLVLG